MDIFAHGLWTAALFKAAPKRPQKPRPRIWLAVLFGVAPDLVAFGPHTIASILGISRIPLTVNAEPTAYRAFIPSYIYHVYNFSHSLVVFMTVFALAWLIFRRPILEMLGWGLHVLIDIPTHSASFFPTHFLWPISNMYFSGTSWGAGWFMLANYISLAAVYAMFWIIKRRNKPSPQ